MWSPKADGLGCPPGEAEEQVPVWGAVEPPPWERKGGAVQRQEAGQVPFYVYLLASAVTAIAELLPFPFATRVMHSSFIDCLAHHLS
jgi:hypothetical protein